MKILTHDVRIFPYDDIKYKIIKIGADPISIPEDRIYAYDIPNYYGGHKKSDIYFDSATQEVKEWSAIELLDNYKLKVKLDMEKKAFRYVSRLDYRIRYYNDFVELGGTLTTGMQNDKVDKQNSSIVTKEYIRDRAVAINAATTKEGIDIEYNDFLEKYNKRLQELENVL